MAFIRPDPSITFSIQGTNIPTVQEEKVKCLGKFFDETLKDVNSIKDVQCELKKWLNIIDKCQLQSRFKAWIFLFGVLPRLQWPFLLYFSP